MILDMDKHFDTTIITYNRNSEFISLSTPTYSGSLCLSSVRKRSVDAIYIRLHG